MTGFIPWNVVDRQLRAIRTIWISTTRPDGRPHSIPVWFLWEDGAPPSLVFTSSSGEQKVRNLAHQAWVIAHAGDGDDVLILEGVAERITDDSELVALDRAYGDKYVDPGSGTRAAFGVDDPVYRIRVRHVMIWIYGSIANRTDWHFDAS